MCVSWFLGSWCSFQVMMRSWEWFYERQTEEVEHILYTKSEMQLGTIHWPLTGSRSGSACDVALVRSVLGFPHELGLPFRFGGGMSGSSAPCSGPFPRGIPTGGRWRMGKFHLPYLSRTEYNCKIRWAFYWFVTLAEYYTHTVQIHSIAMKIFNRFSTYFTFFVLVIYYFTLIHTNSFG